MSRKPIRKARTFFQKRNAKKRFRRCATRLTPQQFDFMEDFRPLLERIRKPSPKGGRPPYDEIFMFKCLVLQELYGLSDQEVEYQIADRCSFQKFLGMDITSDVPDHATINNFRNLLKDLRSCQRIIRRFQSSPCRAMAHSPKRRHRRRDVCRDSPTPLFPGRKPTD